MTLVIEYSLYFTRGIVDCQINEQGIYHEWEDSRWIVKDRNPEYYQEAARALFSRFYKTNRTLKYANDEYSFTANGIESLGRTTDPECFTLNVLLQNLLRNVAANQLFVEEMQTSYFKIE